MTTTADAPSTTRSRYTLRGSLLEACSCGVLCPCWIGEDPDRDDCQGIIGYHIDAGQIDGVDVSGLSLVNVVYIPANALAGNWAIVMLVDAKASEQQREALLAAFGGKLGGPLADLASLVGTVKGIEYVSIRHEVSGGSGSLSIPGMVEAEMEPFRSADGTVTTLRDSIFSTVPGSPAYVAKATRNRVDLPNYGLTWEYEGQNAVQADWELDFAA